MLTAIGDAARFCATKNFDGQVTIALVDAFGCGKT